LQEGVCDFVREADEEWSNLLGGLPERTLPRFTDGRLINQASCLLSRSCGCQPNTLKVSRQLFGGSLAGALEELLPSSLEKWSLSLEYVLTGSRFRCRFSTSPERLCQSI
jgi:hypothetical protein